MIGFQCAPSAQQVASSLVAAANQQRQAKESNNQTTDHQNQSPPNSSSTSSSPISGEQQNQSGSSSSKSSSASSRTSSTNSHLAGHIRSLINAGNPAKREQQQQQQQQNLATTTSSMHSSHSPGYHSAASSPTSSAASPVSSTNSSSGISTAGSMSASSAHTGASPVAATSHNHHHHHHHHNSNHHHHSGANSNQSVSPSSASRSPVSPNLLDYYPELNQDGLGLSWFHNANNRAQLGVALLSNKMVVSGDISLAEMSRYPVPIMAKPPLGISDITLENWLQEVVMSPVQKGIKLTFTSTRTVEPAFRVLARHAEHLKGPMILNADILSRPTAAASHQGGRNNRQQQQQQQQGAQQPVDAWTFLMLCRTRFPKSIISIGWCSPTTGAPPDESLSGQINHAANADSSSSAFHLSADSMFDLDIMDTSQPGGGGQLSAATVAAAAAAAAAAAGQLQHLGQHLGHHHHHNHLHNHHHRLQANPYPLISHHHHHQQQQHHNSNQHLISHHLQNNINNNNHNHHSLTHHILSSTGSLNSSSGNSSGSPSPTSPVSHLMSPPHQTIATNLSLGSAQSSNESSTIQSVKKEKANGVAAAAAAAMAAAVMAATASSAFNQHPDNQQLPLNLNINEADQQLSSSKQAAVALSLAQKIQSYQSISQQVVNNGISNLNSHLNHHQELSPSPSPSISHHHHHLSSKLFNNNNHMHVTKKTALSSDNGNSDNPSPHSSVPSPKSHNSHHLLLKTTQQSQSQSNLQQSSGYTREMIDKMASLVKEYNLTQPVTFPVEARRLINSLGELQRLLYQVGSNSTLTVVAQQEDLIGVDDLLTIRRAFATNQILFDLPDELAASLKQELDLM